MYENAAQQMTRGERIAYQFARIIFGAWFLFSGIEYFTPFDLQPLGNTDAARHFTLALIASGLFAWIKIIEVVVAVCLLANRLVLPAALATVPLTVVIGYWNFVLDPGVVEYVFGILTIVFNAVLLWPWRARILALIEWRGA